MHRRKSNIIKKMFYVNKLCIVISLVVWFNCCTIKCWAQTNTEANDHDGDLLLVMSDDDDTSDIIGLQEQYTTLSPTNNQFQTVTNQFTPETTRKRKKPGRKRKRRPNQQRLQQIQRQQAQQDESQVTELPASEPLVFEQSEDEPNALYQTQPVIYEPEQPIKHEPQFDKSFRRPYSEGRKKEKESISSDSSPASELKSILKNADGLSLSEILQQRNLSLTDLLKGKQVALAAITQPTKLESDEPKIIKYVSKPEGVRRLPVVFSRPTTEASVVAELILPPSTQPPRDNNEDLAIDSSNRIPPTIPNLRDLFSKQDRPIKEVIPSIRPDLSNSNSKRLSSLFANRKHSERIPTNFKDKINKLRLTTTTIDNLETTTLEYETPTTMVPTTTTTISSNKFKPLRPRLRLNSKGILVTSTSTSTSTFTPPTSTTRTTTTTTTEVPTTIIPSVRPQKKLKNIIQPVENVFHNFRPKYESLENQDHTQRSFIDYENEDIDVTEINPSLFSDITSIRSVDDRTDLLELMADRRNGARLAKILSQRNMTLDELIEHRKRGSSQLHLSEIFYNKTTPLNNHKLNEAIPDKLDVVTAFETFPAFDLDTLKSVKPDEIKTDSQGSSYFTSIFDIKPTDEVLKEGRAMKMNKKLVQVYNPVVTFKPIATTKSHEFDDSIFTEIDDVDNSLSRANPMLDLELAQPDYGQNSITIETPVSSSSSIPIGIRSAILASSCIVVISVLLFILIFVACRWRQNRNNKLEYHEESLKGRSKAPILERNLSNCSTSPTLYQMSRSSKLNTMDPNSQEVQDYLYDAMRHPF